MATQPVFVEHKALKLEPVAALPNSRALAWDGDLLYASRCYSLYSAQITAAQIEWRRVANYVPEWWRGVTAKSALSCRLLRDGLHALAILPGGNLVAAVPGAIVMLPAGETEFQVSHRLTRGTRPLHIAATPRGQVFWGEYFDNRERSEVHIYGSQDGGVSWQVAHTFGKRAVRHIHNIVYDRWDECLWIVTGDYGNECKIIRASADLSSCGDVISGSQQTRAVAAVVAAEGLYFASDTPLEQNYIYLLDRSGKVHRRSSIPSSSTYGCKNRNGIFFSTMVEPSQVNRSNRVTLVGSEDGISWKPLADWSKDSWSMRLFQYGNAFLPDGENTTDFLSVSTVAVEGADLQTSIYRTVRD